MRVLCLTKYPRSGPSSRYRLLQFVPSLNEDGISLDVHALHDERYLAGRFSGRRPGGMYLMRRFLRRAASLMACRKYDVVFIQKEMFPWVPPVFESLLSAARVPMVLDIDDAIYLFYRGHRFLRHKVEGVMARCRMVLAGNRMLADYAARYCTQTELFPTVVDTDRFCPAPPPDTGRLVVGWIGSPETAGYLHDLVPALESVHRRVPFELRIVGAGPIACAGIPVDARRWSEQTEVADLQGMHVGVMPLPQDDWAEGKCGLKLLQYMSCGVATVSSPRGGARDMVQDGINGFQAESPEDWARRIEELLVDPQRRDRFSANGRETVVTDYSLQRAAPKLGRLLREAAGG